MRRNAGGSTASPSNRRLLEQPNTRRRQDYRSGRLAAVRRAARPEVAALLLRGRSGAGRSLQRARCQAIAKAETVSGNSARLGQSVHLCLCKTPGQDRLAALLLLVQSTSEGSLGWRLF